MENLTEKIVNDEKEEETEVIVEEKEQAYPKLKSKIEILDVLFHPTESNILTLGLINGKIKMYSKFLYLINPKNNYLLYNLVMIYQNKTKD
jgi:hypothetical protein